MIRVSSLYVTFVLSAANTLKIVLRFQATSTGRTALPARQWHPRSHPFSSATPPLCALLHRQHRKTAANVLTRRALLAASGLPLPKCLLRATVAS